MTLISCKECKTEISDQAYNCPKCGVFLRKPKRTRFGKIIKYTFIGFNLLMLFNFVLAFGGNAIIKLTAAVVFWVLGDLILAPMIYITRPEKYK